MSHSWMVLRGDVLIDSCYGDESGVSILRRCLPDQLKQFNATSLTIVADKETGGLKFCKPWKDVSVEEIEWDEGSMYVEDVPPCGSEWEEGMPLLFVRLAQRDRNAQLTVSSSHAVCDGRTSEGIYRIVANVLDKTVVLPLNARLTKFGQQEQFTMTAEDSVTPPLSWKITERGRRSTPELPKSVTEGKETIINSHTYLHYEYAPARAFGKANKVGIQGIIMAGACRGHRKFNGEKVGPPMWVSVPGDTRRSPVATEEHKNRELFSGSAVVLVREDGEESILDEMKQCSERMKEAQGTSDMAKILTFFGSLADEKTGVMRFSDEYPTDIPIVLVSNVGTYSHIKNPRLFCRMAGSKDYNLAIYSYTTGDALELLIIHPKEVNKEFLHCVIDSIDDAFRAAGSKRV